jgi:DNA repair protein SbcD/Mre11
MRFLHTADWHAGKTLRNRSRADEQEKVFAEIVEIARCEHVDAVLIAGDVFESYAPSPDAERLVYSALAGLISSGIPAIVVGGNHDHPRRLAALREILAPLNIFVRAEPQRPEAGGVIEIRARHEIARIAVLPWVPDNKIVDICQLMQPEDTWYSTYAEKVSAMCQRLAAGFSGETVNILAGHLFVFGAQTSGSERPVHVAQPFAIDPYRFPGSAQYVALGHLHRPQEIICPTRCCYAGSPLQLDFGERDQQKRVLIVDVKAGMPAHLESIPLSAGRRLRELAGTFEELKTQAGSVGEDFLRIVVKSETRIPGIADQIRELFPNALDVRQDSPHDEEPLAETNGAKQPHELFADFFRETRGSAPPEDVVTEFQNLYREATRAPD